jgi:hypothetical protein
MDSALSKDRLDRHNCASWSYRMQQYSVSQGYWVYIAGMLETKLVATNSNLVILEQGASRVMFCLATCVHNHMLSYIHNADSLKATWENLNGCSQFTTSLLHIYHHLPQVYYTFLQIRRLKASNKYNLLQAEEFLTNLIVTNDQFICFLTSS